MSQNEVFMNISIRVPGLFGLQRGRKIDASYMLLIYVMDKQAYIIMKNLGEKFSQIQSFLQLGLLLPAQQALHHGMPACHSHQLALRECCSHHVNEPHIVYVLFC